MNPCNDFSHSNPQMEVMIDQSPITKARTHAGFSLIELMVVVAIISVMAVIAVPNFRRYQFKAKQAEGKAYLGAIFASEKAFFAEWETYTTCMEKIGFDRDGFTGKMHYVAGFTATFPGSPGVCVADMRGAAWPVGHGLTATAATNTFTAGASGTLHTVDSWSITELKVMANVISGL